jgi:hypothetical protein
LSFSPPSPNSTFFALAIYRLRRHDVALEALSAVEKIAIEQVLSERNRLIFVERSSTKERYRHPPPPKKGNNLVNFTVIWFIY